MKNRDAKIVLVLFIFLNLFYIFIIYSEKTRRLEKHESSSIETNIYGISRMRSMGMMGEISQHSIPRINDIKVMFFAYQKGNVMFLNEINIVLTKGKKESLVRNILPNIIRSREFVYEYPSGTCMAICFWMDKNLFLNFYAIPQKDKHFALFKNKMPYAYSIYKENIKEAKNPFMLNL